MSPKKAKRFFLDIISFNTPQAIVINISSILVLLAAVPTKYLVYSPFKCVFRNVILPLMFHGGCPISGIFAGCNCPACGMTRAMSRLLHGDIIGAWDFNHMVFFLFVAMATVLIINLARSVRHYSKTGRLI